MSYKTEIPPLDTDTPATPPNTSKGRPCYQVICLYFLRKLGRISTAAATTDRMVREAPAAQAQGNHTALNYKKSQKGFSVSVMAQKVGNYPNYRRT